jgi:hypothetical protein
VSIHYFGQFNPFHYSSLPLLSHPLLVNSFQYISLYPLPAMYFDFFFSFTSSSGIHRVVPLLQTFSSYKFVYDQVWIYINVYLLDLCSTYEKRHAAFVFLNLACFT